MMLRSIRLGFLSGLLFAVVFIGTATGETFNLSGTWESDYGDVVLDWRDGRFEGTYGGEGHGKVTLEPGPSGAFTGFWFKNSSSVECDIPRNGTHYWGRLIMESERSAVRRKMKWGYCDDPSPESNWQLTRPVRHVYVEGTLRFLGEVARTRILALNGKLEFFGSASETKYLYIEDALQFHGEEAIQ